MADIIKAVAITEKMLHMRDTMRSLWGANYDAKITEWQTAITRVAEGKNLQPLQAAMALAEAADRNPMAVIILMAAIVEMEERPVPVTPAHPETSDAVRT